MDFNNWLLDGKRGLISPCKNPIKWKERDQFNPVEPYMLKKEDWLDLVNILKSQKGDLFLPVNSCKPIKGGWTDPEKSCKSKKGDLFDHVKTL